MDINFSDLKTLHNNRRLRMKIIAKMVTLTVLFLLSVGTLWAGDVTGGATTTIITLYTYVADTPAKASEVNQNFALIRDAVNEKIESITAGSGLTGGGTKGDVTVSVGTGTITATHLATNSVYAAEIATSAVGTSEIADGSVTGTDIANSSITAADIADEPAVKERHAGSWVTIPTSYADLNYISFTAPASGRVLVSASGTLSLKKTSSTVSGFWGLDLYTAPDTAPGVTPMGGSKSASRGYFQPNFRTQDKAGESDNSI